MLGARPTVVRPRGRRRWLAPLLLGATAAAGATLGAGYLLARPSRSTVGAPPPDLGAASVRIPSGSGSVLAGWYAPPRRAGQGAVLLLHGVRSDRRQMIGRARFLHAAGYGVLLVDLQAHGESPGARITYGARESLDAHAALAWLAARAPGSPLAAIGVSMGGASALLGRSPLPVRALVLEAVYPTIEQATARRLRVHLGPAGPAAAPLLLAQLRPLTGVAATALRPIDCIAAVGAPVFVITGAADRYTTLAESESLFARARQPREFWAVPRAGHVDLHAAAPAEYERRVLAFLAGALAPPDD